MNLWAFDARGTVFPASRQGAKRGDRRKEQRDGSLSPAIVIGFGRSDSIVERPSGRIGHHGRKLKGTNAN